MQECGRRAFQYQKGAIKTVREALQAANAACNFNTKKVRLKLVRISASAR